jgi:hypothetical protein
MSARDVVAGMNPSDADNGALDQLKIAEAELAMLKQELVLQHLIDTREPTEEARKKLHRLRQLVEQLTAKSSSDNGMAA